MGLWSASIPFCRNTLSSMCRYTNMHTGLCTLYKSTTCGVHENQQLLYQDWLVAACENCAELSKDMHCSYAT